MRNCTMVDVEVFVVLSALFHAVQVVCGWWRRCSSNSCIKYSLWLAYTAKPSLAVYTFGLVNATSFRRGSWFAKFGLALLMALGGTNSMTAYSIDDNKQYTRHFIHHSLYFLSYFSISDLYKMSDITIDFPTLGTIMMFLLYLIVSINPGSIFASITASSCLDKQTSNIVEHMENKHTESTSYDPVTLEGYDYLVHENIGSPTQITVGEIWVCQEGLLGSTGGKQLKEVCLSFALFRLLRRRLFGIPFPESKLQKTRDIVMKGLMSDVENANCDAAYRVIAAELAFTHDHLFTSSASFNSGLGEVKIIFGILKTMLYLLLGVLFVREIVTEKAMERAELCDTVLAAVIMLVFPSLELLQFYLYFSSDWYLFAAPSLG